MKAFRHACLSSIASGFALFAAVGCGTSQDLAELDLTEAKESPRALRCGAGTRPAEWTVVGGDGVLMPDCGQPRSPQGQLGSNGRHVLFANFDGIDARPGDMSLQDLAIRGLMHDDVIKTDRYDPENPGRLEAILTVQKQVAAWYSDFNVDIVISRPLSGDYMMTVVGDRESTLGYPGGVLGISPIDCKNMGEVDVDWAFTGSIPMQPHETFRSAIIVAHEAGHALGLGHTRNTDDIMYPSVGPDSMPTGFTGGVVNDPGPCNLRTGVDVQDSHQVLLDNLGPRPPEFEKPGVSSPPVVRVLSPVDGAIVGRDLTIAVDAQTQAHGGIDRVTVSLSLSDGTRFRGGHPVAELRPPQSATQIRLSDPGLYELVATAYDQFGNVALVRSQFSVATLTCGEPNDCAPGQKCMSNVCITPPTPSIPPTGDPEGLLRPLGTTCTDSSECKLSGICALTPLGRLCTKYCSPAHNCDGDLQCTDGICLPPIYSQVTPKLGQLGGKCTRNKDCYSGMCSPGFPIGELRYCTHACDPETAWACPAGMACTMADTVTGMKNICQTQVAPVAPESGGCDLTRRGSPSPAGWQVFLGLLFALGLIRVRNPGLRRKRIYA